MSPAHAAPPGDSLESAIPGEVGPPRSSPGAGQAPGWDGAYPRQAQAGAPAPATAPPGGKGYAQPGHAQDLPGGPPPVPAAEPAARAADAGVAVPAGGTRWMGALSSAVDFVRHVLTIVEVEIRKLRHDPVELFTRAVQPALWMLVFGQVMARLRGIPTGGLPYLDFMAPGILAQSTLFVAIFYGISVIWERDLGILHKYMASPISRTALVLGKALSAGVRGFSQAVVVYVLAILTGVQARHDLPAMAGVVAAVILGAAVFSTFSLVMACLVKTRERFMGIGQVFTMPLFFASNAIYPLALMPAWLHGLARINPLTYQVDALRGLMIQGGASQFGLAYDYGMMLLVLAVLVAVAARLYPRAVT